MGEIAEVSTKSSSRPAEGKYNKYIGEMYRT